MDFILFMHARMKGRLTSRDSVRCYRVIQGTLVIYIGFSLHISLNLRPVAIISNSSSSNTTHQRMHYAIASINSCHINNASASVLWHSFTLFSACLINSFRCFINESHVNHLLIHIRAQWTFWIYSQYCSQHAYYMFHQWVSCKSLAYSHSSIVNLLNLFTIFSSATY